MLKIVPPKCYPFHINVVKVVVFSFATAHWENVNCASFLPACIVTPGSVVFPWGLWEGLSLLILIHFSVSDSFAKSLHCSFIPFLNHSFSCCPLIPWSFWAILLFSDLFIKLYSVFHDLLFHWRDCYDHYLSAKCILPYLSLLMFTLSLIFTKSQLH